MRCQAAPPPDAGVVTMKLRVRVPLPHDVEHVPYGPQLPAQSTGHAGRFSGVSVHGAQAALPTTKLPLLSTAVAHQDGKVPTPPVPMVVQSL